MSTSFFYRKFSCYVLHGRDIGVWGGAGKVFYMRTESNHPPPVEIDCRQFLRNNPNPPKSTVGSFYAVFKQHKLFTNREAKPCQNRPKN